MVVLIDGASHTGKTCLAQRLLEKYKMPYLSIDHLKMGLIRSGHTTLTPADDEKLTEYLWPIVREMVKTVIENHQDLIVEGCYIPAEWEKDFTPEYLREIRCCCLVMTRDYIRSHSADILAHGNEVEHRLYDDCDMTALITANEANLAMCREYGYHCILIDDRYQVDLDLEES